MRYEWKLKALPAKVPKQLKQKNTYSALLNIPCFHTLIFEKRFDDVTYCLIVLQSYLYDKGEKQIIEQDSCVLTM